MSTPEQFRRIELLFEQALDLESVAREALLAQVARSEPEVAQTVARLLARHENGGDTARIGTELSRAIAAADPELEVGERVGPYRIVRRLGAGGMGEVFEAEQEEPIRRRVALKVVKWGLDTRAVLERFAGERQALELMDHPGIARVLDAGATAGGRPYFVMELVEGEPITDFCDRHGLGLEARLLLLARVCDAVQHAHQRGVIHRDLKPSNVLVVMQDEGPVPKIIDFGIAKAIDRGQAIATALTHQGVLIGTPEYMSPEQADLSPDVDTRSDVYSLGVILYELMVGELPIDAQALRRAGLEEIRRLIREQEPIRPSERLRRLARSPGGKSSPGARTSSSRDPVSLARRLRGDLDWITWRALDKQRAQRYASASELAEDLRRHLRHEPVSAGPPSTAYQLRKFARRHRVGVAAAAIALAAIVSGSLLAIAGLLEARRAQLLAEQEAARAQLEATTSERVVDFLAELFGDAGPGSVDAAELTARELLDRGVEQLRTALDQEPVVKARLLDTLARLEARLGRQPAAIDLYQEAASLRPEALVDSPDALRARRALAGTLIDADRMEEAAAILEELERHWRLSAPEDPELARVLHTSAQLRRKQSDHEGAIELYRRAIAVGEATLGTDVWFASPLVGLGRALAELGRYEEARAPLERALALEEREYGPDHHQPVLTRHELGNVELFAGNYERAREHYERALAVQERVLGPESLEVGNLLTNLATVLQETGDLAGAHELQLRSMEIKVAALGLDHTRVGISLNNLGNVEVELGELDSAEQRFRSAIDIFERKLGRDHPHVSYPLLGLANVLANRGGGEEAQPLYERSVTLRETALGANNPQTAEARTALGRNLTRLGRAAEARVVLEQAIADQEAALEPDHPYLSSARSSYAECLRALGELDAAESAARAALASMERSLGAEHFKLAPVIELLAGIVESAGRSVEAAELIERARGLDEGE